METVTPDRSQTALSVSYQGATRTFEPADVVTIGRDSDAVVHVDDPRVSRRHATVRFEEGSWVVVDDGSANGTFVQGRRTTRLVVRGSHQINLGDPGGPVISVFAAAPETAPGEGTATVTAPEGGDAGTATITVGGKPPVRVVRIGRSPDNDIVLGEPLVSWHHAELRGDPATGLELVDLNSRNGTFVNGERVKRVRLAQMDLVVIGDHSFRLIGNELQPTDGAPAERTGEQRRLATILFTDIVGSTQLAADLGDKEWGEKLAAHDSAVRETVAAGRGRVLKSTGDGVLALFDHPGEAVACAGSLIDAMADLGLEIRSGIHTGEIEMRPEDVHGIGVHIAARVAAGAGPSEIVITSTVKDLTTGSDYTFQSKGRQTLRDVPGEWELFSVEG